MREVVMEVDRGGGKWVRVGGIAEVEPMGSISSTNGDGRRLFLFGWGEGGPGVWESTAGFDRETAAVREVRATHLERRSDLAEPYQLDVHRPGGAWITVRFTVAERATWRTPRR